METGSAHAKKLAPFASLEDLSDNSASPVEGEANFADGRDTEDMKDPSSKNLTVTNIAAPRIDISRASSSSHHEDSSPEDEREIMNASGSKLDVGYSEEMTSDLHSSTEELTFQDSQDLEKSRKKKRTSSQQIIDIQTESRKDSGCSDVVLLSISGRTSRVSSVGSVASGGSAVSNISATSNLSKVSRGSSPHRMLLETSFCGPKPISNISVDYDDSIKSFITKKLTETEEGNTPEPEVVFAKDTPQDRRANDNRSASGSSRASSTTSRNKPVLENPQTQKFISLYSDGEDDGSDTKKPAASGRTKKNLTVSSTVQKRNKEQKQTPIITLRDESRTCQPNPFSPKRLKPFTNTTLVNFINKYEDENGSVEVSGGDAKPVQPINEEFERFMLEPESNIVPSSVSGVTDSGLFDNKRIVIPVQVHQECSPAGERTDYVPSTSSGLLAVEDVDRKLTKSDSCLESIISTTTSAEDTSMYSANYLTVTSYSDVNFRSHSDDRNLSRLSPSVSPNLSRHRPNHLNLTYSNRSVRSMTQLTGRDDSRTPSPGAPKSGSIKHFMRRCSVNEIAVPDKPKSRSSSIKSMFSSIFKRTGSVQSKRPKSKPDGILMSEHRTRRETIANPEQARKGPDTVIIPLHSPDDESKEKCSLSKQSSETKFSAMPKNMTIISSNYLIGAQSKSTNIDNNMENDVAASNAQVSGHTNAEQQRQQAEKEKILDKEAERQPETKIAEEPVKLGSEGNSVRDMSTMVDETDIPAAVEGNAHPQHSKVDEVCQMPDFENKTTSIDEDMTAIRAAAESVADADTQYEPQLVQSLQNVNINTIPQLAERKEDQGQQTDEQQTNELSSNAVGTGKDVEEVSTDSDIISTLIAPNNEEENKQLVDQSESFEEELPYVPTTLPLERSAAVPIIPVKERIVEVKTCPVVRPRSRSTLNPALLDNYVAATTSLPAATESLPHSSSEKLHITLPRSDVASENTKVKSPLSKKPWTKFAESGMLPSPKKLSNCAARSAETDFAAEDPSFSTPPTLPPRKSGTWISFDDGNQEEVRQSPKKITTLPSSRYSESAVALQKAVNRFSQKLVFVNPDECSCECHESQHHTHEEVKTHEK